MTKIIAISGKKQSGKSTCGNFLVGSAMLSMGLLEYAYISEEGDLIVPYESGNGETKPCSFPVTSFHPNVTAFLSENVWPEIKIYSFADTLKISCMNILGLTHEQCYGTEEDKNTETILDWSSVDPSKQKSGKLTAREALQYVGTNFFRRIYPNVWVDSTIRRIEAEQPKLAVVVDCRFPNEVEGIQKAGGKVIRLTKNPFEGQDDHPSETALDDYDNFDAVIDNSEMSIGEKNEAIYNQLADWNFVNYSAVARIGVPA